MGDRFGALTVLQETRLPNPPAQVARGCTAGVRAATVVCDCGTEKIVRLSHLTSGAQVSCGCVGVQRRNLARHGTPSDGRKSHLLYGTHDQMMKRCYDPDHAAYHRYGGRGIDVAPQWHDVRVFCADLDALLGPRPEGYTLDRIDNERGYWPDNVRWATWVEQAANRRPRSSS